MDVIQFSKKTLDATWSLANIPLSFRAGALRMKYLESGKRIRPFKNKYQDQTCFILGGGPSLKHVDTSRLPNEKCISVNMLYRLESLKQVKPVFHCAIDDAMYRGDIGVSFLEYIKLSPDTGFLVSHNAPAEIAAHPNVYIAPLGYLPSSACRAFDLSRPSLAFVNSVCYAIETALYLGFSKIVLLGCDFTQFTVRHEIHAYGEEPEETRDFPLFCDLMGHAIAIMHHEYLYAEAKRKGVEIYNATEGSMLDVYPMVDLDGVLGAR